jgi:aerobic-type carbon monoxide dehydrogenase small subunit (CoxS/CutS family)
MSDRVTLNINGCPVHVPQGTTVAAALEIAGATHARRSVSHKARGALCGMGVCFECRVTIDNVPHCRSCQTLCVQGMEVVTDD